MNNTQPTPQGTTSHVPACPCRPVVRSPRQCCVIMLAGNVNRFLATGIDTAGAVAQWEVVVPPGGGLHPHVHTREVETMLVLDGRIVLDIGGQMSHAGVGDFVVLPIGVAHAVRNESNEQAVLVFTVAPAGLEQFFFEAGIEVPADSIGSPTRTADEASRMRQAAPKYGIRFVDHTTPGSVQQAPTGENASIRLSPRVTL